MCKDILYETLKALHSILIFVKIILLQYSFCCSILEIYFPSSFFLIKKKQKIKADEKKLKMSRQRAGPAKEKQSSPLENSQATEYIVNYIARFSSITCFSFNAVRMHFFNA